MKPGDGIEALLQLVDLVLRELPVPRLHREPEFRVTHLLERHELAQTRNVRRGGRRNRCRRGRRGRRRRLDSPPAGKREHCGQREDEPIAPHGGIIVGEGSLAFFGLL